MLKKELVQQSAQMAELKLQIDENNEVVTESFAKLFEHLKIEKDEYYSEDSRDE